MMQQINWQFYPASDELIRSDVSGWILPFAKHNTGAVWPKSINLGISWNIY